MFFFVSILLDLLSMSVYHKFSMLVYIFFMFLGSYEMSKISQGFDELSEHRHIGANVMWDKQCKWLYQ